MRKLKQLPPKDGLTTDYSCGVSFSGSWHQRLEKHNEFTESPKGKYILKLEALELTKDQKEILAFTIMQLSTKVKNQVISIDEFLERSLISMDEIVSYEPITLKR